MKPATGKKSRVASTTPAQGESVRTGLGVDAIARALIENLHCLQAKLPQHATRNDWYMALAYTVRDRLFDRCLTTVETITETDTSAKLVAYLSAEFLTGPHLGNSLLNLDMWDAARQAVSQVGQDLDTLLELLFDVPPVPPGARDAWRRCLDSALASPDDISAWADAPSVAGTGYLVQPRSVVVLAHALRPAVDASHTAVTS